MKLSIATILTVSVGYTSAFVPSSKVSPAKKNLAMSDEATAPSDIAAPVESSSTSAKAVFGWVPDASKPCYGLPGAVDPLGFFDPLEISKQGDLNYVKRLREAEVMHGRGKSSTQLNSVRHTPSRSTLTHSLYLVDLQLP